MSLRTDEDGDRLMLTPRTLVIDVPPQRVDAVVAFWAAALDATPRWPTRADDPFVALDGARSALGVVVQAAPGVPRYHLDLAASDVASAAQTLMAEGATKVRQEGDRAVLRDPAGLLLCVVPEATASPTTAPAGSRGAHLGGLFVDVAGSRAVETELAFWGRALGAAETPTSRPETYTELTGVRGPGGDLLVEVQRLHDGGSRFHVDLLADDVLAEAARMERLGATRIAEIESWVTLADPAGNLFCVVPA